MNKKLINTNQLLFANIKQFIEEPRQQVSQAVSAGVTGLFRKIGKRISQEILNNQRAAYGKQIVATLWRQLSWSHFYTLNIHLF